MTYAQVAPSAGSPGPGSPDMGLYEPGAVVDAVIRLLVDAHVPVAIGSVARAEESAGRLLDDLGVAAAPASPNRAYWAGVVDTISDRHRGDDVSDDASSGTAVADEAGEPR